jgi:hypothetical protein
MAIFIFMEHLHGGVPSTISASIQALKYMLHRIASLQGSISFFLSAPSFFVVGYDYSFITFFALISGCCLFLHRF